MQKKGNFSYIRAAVLLIILLFIVTTLLVGPFGQINDKKYSCDAPAICVENGVQCASEGDGLLIPAGLCIIPPTKSRIGTCCKSAEQIENELKHKVNPPDEGEKQTIEEQINAQYKIQVRLDASKIPVLDGVGLKKDKQVSIYIWADSKNPYNKCSTYITTKDGKAPEAGSGFEDFSESNKKTSSCAQATEVKNHLERTDIQKIQITPLKTGEYKLISLLKNKLGEVISTRTVELNVS